MRQLISAKLKLQIVCKKVRNTEQYSFYMDTTVHYSCASVLHLVVGTVLLKNHSFTVDEVHHFQYISFSTIYSFYLAHFICSCWPFCQVLDLAVRVGDIPLHICARIRIWNIYKKIK